jgi:hypothetical protein
MRHRLFLVLLLLAVATPAHAEKFTIDDDTFYTLGFLGQPQFTVTQDSAPGGGVATDFFLRRGRLVLTGQIDPHIGFIFITDQANYGKAGDFTTQFFIQDALASYKFGPQATISAGFMLLPFTRNDYQSAGALNTIDFRTPVLKFLPTGKAFRDMGVEVRGLLAGDRVYYRGGVFSGISGKAASDTAEEVNTDDSPRLTGNLRYNIFGKEEAYANPGIYFAKDPIVNVGVGADWQHEALGSTGKTQYLALAVDVFADIPLNDDMEVVAQAAVLLYDHAAVGATRDDGTAFFVEAGFRYQMIEPVVAFEYFNGDIDGSQVTTTRLGLNWWISKHVYNVKFELAIPNTEKAAGATTDPPDNLIGTVQTQVSF